MPVSNTPDNNPLNSPCFDKSPQQIQVEVNSEHAGFCEGERSLVDAVRQAVFYSGRRSGFIEVSVVTDDTIHRINREHLNHDWPTDVISFPYEDDDGHVEGELIVSWDTACRVAEELGLTAFEELELYVIHGTLHLCGFDDQTDSDRAVMRSAEAAVKGQLTKK